MTHEAAVLALKSTGEHVRLTLAKGSRKTADDASSVTAHDSPYASGHKHGV